MKLGSGTLEKFLINQKLDQCDIDLTVSDDEDEVIVVPSSSSKSSPARKTRGKKSDYIEMDDEEFFKEAARPSVKHVAQTAKQVKAIGKAFAEQSASSFSSSFLLLRGDFTDLSFDLMKIEAEVRQLNLQNSCIQLRKVANHPYLFNWDKDPTTRKEVVDERLLACSGKMMLLEILLTELFKDGHKVLLFSQFTRTLDIMFVPLFFDGD